MKPLGFVFTRALFHTKDAASLRLVSSVVNLGCVLLRIIVTKKKSVKTFVWFIGVATKECVLSHQESSMECMTSWVQGSKGG